MKKIFAFISVLFIVHFSFAQADKLDALIDAYAKLYKFKWLSAGSKEWGHTPE
jgi:hypothetical protein